MTELVKLLVNGEAVLEYNKKIELTENQQAYIDDMDQIMDKGIELGGESIAKPELMQKSQFVAFTLMGYLKVKNDESAIAMFSYLVNRLPELKQVEAKYERSVLGIEFIFDQDHLNWQKIELSGLKH